MDFYTPPFQAWERLINVLGPDLLGICCEPHFVDDTLTIRLLFNADYKAPDSLFRCPFWTARTIADLGAQVQVTSHVLMYAAGATSPHYVHILHTATSLGLTHFAKDLPYGYASFYRPELFAK